MPSILDVSNDAAETQITIEQAARNLARVNVEYEPEIIKTYWFPDEATVRLVHVDHAAGPTEQIRPFYFGRDLQSGLPFASGVALILPENGPKGEKQLDPPAEWGKWDDARVIYDAAKQ